MRRLEQVVVDLRGEIRHNDEASHARTDELADRLRRSEERLTQTTQLQEQARMKALRRQIEVETTCTLLFVVGTALGVWASLI